MSVKEQRFRAGEIKKLLKQIEQSKHAGLARVLMGLGIRFVGERTADAGAGVWIDRRNHECERGRTGARRGEWVRAFRMRLRISLRGRRIAN